MKIPIKNVSANLLRMRFRSNDIMYHRHRMLEIAKNKSRPGFGMRHYSDKDRFMDIAHKVFNEFENPIPEVSFKYATDAFGVMFHAPSNWKVESQGPLVCAKSNIQFDEGAAFSIHATGHMSVPLNNSIVKDQTVQCPTLIAFSSCVYAGSEYAVFPCTETESGKAIAMVRPNYGSFEGKPFFIGSNGLGIFLSEREGPRLVARANKLNSQGNQIFAATSSSKVNDFLLFQIADPFEKDIVYSFCLEPNVKDSEVFAKHPNAIDDSGQQLVTFENNYVIEHNETEKEVEILLKPNKIDAAKKPYIFLESNHYSDGLYYTIVEIKEEIGVKAQLQSNFLSSNGQHWFTSYPNSVDDNGNPVLSIFTSTNSILYELIQ